MCMGGKLNIDLAYNIVLISFYIVLYVGWVTRFWSLGCECWWGGLCAAFGNFWLSTVRPSNQYSKAIFIAQYIIWYLHIPPPKEIVIIAVVWGSTALSHRAVLVFRWLVTPLCSSRGEPWWRTARDPSVPTSRISRGVPCAYLRLLHLLRCCFIMIVTKLPRDPHAQLAHEFAALFF
jgi:hypothetical protein